MISVSPSSRGIHLPEAGIWLDPRRRSEMAFVSHAHSDHAGRHQRTILSQATSRLMRIRLGKPTGSEEILPWGEMRDFGSFRARLLPAGHVLGSAQIYIEHASGSLLYTGDFKLEHGASCETMEHCEAETLIMETTFGLPHFRFPSRQEIAERLLDFCHNSLTNGFTPVLLGYSLGKAQEILALLRDVNVPIVLQEAAWKITRVYEEFGIAFPAYEKWTPDTDLDGKVIICAPGYPGIDSIPRRRTVLLSGWALLPGAPWRFRCGAALPLSDHAGFEDLLKYVALVRPRRVLTVHGYTREFAQELRRRGIEAWTLAGSDQLEFPGIVSC